MSSLTRVATFLAWIFGCMKSRYRKPYGPGALVDLARLFLGSEVAVPPFPLHLPLPLRLPVSLSKPTFVICTSFSFTIFVASSMKYLVPTSCFVV